MIRYLQDEIRARFSRLDAIRYLQVPFSGSHGVRHDTLGAAEFYRFISRFRSPRSVLVVGSGAGFVPLVFLDNSDCELVLVDAFLDETGNGGPMDFSPSREQCYRALKAFENRILFLEAMSADFFEVAKKAAVKFDVLFIDGDHSESGFAKDVVGVKHVAAEDAVILFHDTNLPWVRSVADRLLPGWFDIPQGMGTGVYFVDGALRRCDAASRTDNRGKLVAMADELKQSRDANKWSYLESPAFEARFAEAHEFLRDNFKPGERRSLIEIGGNPAPFSEYLLRQGMALSVTNVEPAISEHAERKFEALRENHATIRQRLDEIGDEAFDVVVVFGVDLSLARSFEDFERSFRKIRSLIEKSKVTILEAPEYMPSRVLQEALLSGYELKKTAELHIDVDVGVLSISPKVLRRRLFVATPGDGKASAQGAGEDWDSLLAAARAYALRDVPNAQVMVSTGAFAPDRISSWFGYPVENDGTQDFCWLGDRLAFKLPGDASRLEFQLSGQRASMSGVDRLLNRLGPFVSVAAQEEKLIVALTPLGRLLHGLSPRRTFSLKLPYFVPSELPGGATDERKLSFRVTSLTIS